ncbi:MAG TPA: hypothetical protein VGE15_10725 [Sphingobacteriaceae bacterium]
MKSKPNLFRSRSGRSRARIVHILLSRKFRQLNDEKLIVWLSIVIFLMQLLIIVTAVTAGPATLQTDTIHRVESVSVPVPLEDPATRRPCLAIRNRK